MTLASGYANDNDALSIRAEARVLGATIKKGERVALPVEASRHIYLVTAKGTVEINGTRIDARDGAAITGETTLEVVGVEDAEVVVVDAQ